MHQAEGGNAMEIRFMTKNTEVPADLRDYMEKKLSKMEKFFPKIENSQILVKMVKNTYITELTANVNGVVMRGEQKDLDLRKSFDLGLKNLERRIRRHKEYLVDRTHLRSNDDITFDIEPEIEETPTSAIVKEKHFNLVPMTPEEATMQMELLEHAFFVFLNGNTGKINVVYKRNAGGYGIIIPD